MAKRSAVYVRLPSDVREQLESHAKNVGVRLSTAAADLLALGLEYSRNKQTLDGLQERVGELESTNKSYEGQVQQLTTKLEAVQNDLSFRLRLWERSYQKVVDEMKSTPMSQCPYTGCAATLSAYDVIMEKTCPRCGQWVSWNYSSGAELAKNLFATIGAVSSLVFLAKWLSE